jgi:hypothetical protein
MTRLCSRAVRSIPLNFGKMYCVSGWDSNIRMKVWAPVWKRRNRSFVSIEEKNSQLLTHIGGKLNEQIINGKSLLILTERALLLKGINQILYFISAVSLKRIKTSWRYTILFIRIWSSPFFILFPSRFIT